MATYKTSIYTLLVAVIVFVCPCFANAQNKILLDSLKQQLSVADSDSTKANLLFEIGKENWFGRNFPEAIHHLTLSVVIAEKSNHHKHLADAYNLIANIYMKQERYDSAFISLQHALNQNNERFAPLIFETYSKLYYQLGDYQAALKYALQSADGYGHSQDTLINMQSVFSYLTIGDIFMKLNQHERAIDYYKKAYDKGKRSKTNWYIKSPIQKIADYSLMKNDLQTAVHLYDTIIIIDKDAPSFEPTMHSYEGLGNIAMKRGQFVQAIDLYKKALLYARQKDLRINIENLSTALGSAFLAKDQLDSALYYLNFAAQSSLTSKNFYNLSHAYLQLSTLQQKLKQSDQSLVSFRLHKLYNDSLITIEKIKTVNNLEILYRTRQQENEILQLQKAQQEKDFDIKKRNIYIGIGIGLVVMLIVILLLVRRTYKHQRHLQEEKVNQLEKQQQVMSLQSMVNGQEAERTRIAKDLHDGLGGLFSTVKMHLSTLQHEVGVLKHNELFQKSYGLVDTASTEVRRIAHNMMPEVLIRLGLINAVRDLCNNISAGRLLTISLEVFGFEKRLNASTEIMLYRIIQELINNIIKHAHATEAIIQFTQEGNRLTILVEDNGKGFNSLEADLKPHAGMQTIRSRVNYLNGKLTIDSQKGVGTTVIMDFLINT
jgi:two-component system, NarL family, sensor kinase